MKHTLTNPLSKDADGVWASLVNWGIPWTLVWLCELCLIGLQALIFASVFASYKAWSLEAFALYFLSFSAAFGAFGAYRYWNQSKAFVTSETESDLGSLVQPYSLLLESQIFSVLGIFLSLVAPIAARASLPAGAFLLGLALPTLGLFLSTRQCLRSPYPSDFLKHFSLFAKKNVYRSALLFFLLVSLSLASLFLPLFGAFESTAHCLFSFSTFVFATAAAVGVFRVWRALRDLNRNPAPIYFERVLAGLGLYWFLIPIATGIYFLAAFALLFSFF